MKPQAKQATKEEYEAYMKNMLDPDYYKKRYEALDRAAEFMDLCNKGAEWIIEIYNFCTAQGIQPNKLIDTYRILNQLK